MVTVSVIVDKSAEVGVMVCTPDPGMLKLMVSAPTLSLASLIASRKLQCVASQLPSLTSLFELTMKVSAKALVGAKQNAAKPEMMLATASPTLRVGNAFDPCINYLYFPLYQMLIEV